MSNDERARILRMISEGIVTPAEGEELLSALENAPRAESRQQRNFSFGPEPPSPPLPPRPTAGRNLVIQVREGDESKVNVRIPFGLARAAGKFMPRHAQRALEGYDIDLGGLLESLSTAESGSTLMEVQDGDNHVRIAVE